MGGVRFLQDLPVDVVVELGRTRMTFRQLAAMEKDDVIDLDRSSDDPLDIVAGGKVLARGDLVVDGDRMAIRITELVGESAEEEE